MKALKLVKGTSGRTYLEGTFLEMMKGANRNGRQYNLYNVANKVKEANEEIANGRFLGELGHPDRIETEISNVSHKIDQLYLGSDNQTVKGRLEVLSTPKGELLKRLIDQKVDLYAGMRASGTTDQYGQTEIDRIYSFDIIHNKTDEMEQIKWGGEIPPPPPKPKLKHRAEKKKLLIFAVHVPVGTQSEAKSRSRLAELRAQIGQEFEMLEYQSDIVVKTFVFPSKDDTSKMECIYSGEINYHESIHEETKGFSVGDDIEEHRPPEAPDYMGDLGSRKEWENYNALKRMGKL